MKLLVSGMEYLRRYVSREFHYTMRDLIRLYGWKQIDTWDLWHPRGSLEKRLLTEFEELPKVILFWEGYEFCCLSLKELKDLDCHKCFFADDLHHHDEFERSRNREVLSVFDTILASYGYALDCFYPGLCAVKRIAWIPHSASPDFVLPFNERPENAVFLSGAINRFYPLRQRMERLGDKLPNRIVLHPHPGYHCEYDYCRNEGVGEGYARKINRYRAGFTDSSQFQYVVAKYFEIPATGATLLADGAVSEPLGRLGFIENTHYVSVALDNMDEKIRYVLSHDNVDEIDEIRRRGQELVLSRHKTSDRARLIDEVCS